MLKVSDSTLLELDCVALSVFNVSLTATAKMFPVFEGLGFCCQLDTLI